MVLTSDELHQRKQIESVVVEIENSLGAKPSKIQLEDYIELDKFYIEQNTSKIAHTTTEKFQAISFGFSGAMSVITISVTVGLALNRPEILIYGVLGGLVVFGISAIQYLMIQKELNRLNSDLTILHQRLIAYKIIRRKIFTGTRR